MNKQFMVKYRTKQGGSSTVTTQVSANSSNEAKAKVKQQNSDCTIVSCTEKCCWTIPFRRLMSTPVSMKMEENNSLDNEQGVLIG